MRRRLIAAFAALLLTGVGAVVLLAYVRGADARALAGTETVRVLVVRTPVPVGTPAEELETMVASELLPAKAVADGAVEDLGALAGRVTTVDLQPGEQLLAARFAAPTDLRVPGTVPVPEGAAEVSVLLEPQRAVGGRLTAGDTVGVFVSLTQDAGTTHAVLHRVLVTQVQGAPAPVDPAAEGVETASAGGAAPTGSVMVTLALPAAEAEAVVFGAEHGALWLALEPEGTDTSGTEVITGTTIYGKAFA
ncbi:RcpC/CpaB family pilus assembly protein [Blastococcus sp. HT6-30]|uniref:Flp pilus assembly protein CpaB n=1 Tax=Blastococcus sp. HT6-30 TaxID=3144843 RepID=UPI00321AFB5E